MMEERVTREELLAMAGQKIGPARDEVGLLVEKGTMPTYEDRS